MNMAGREAFEKQDVFGIGAPNDAYAQYFIGQSYLKPLTVPGACPVFLANVTFEPGCRNNWHIHHASKGGGQLLICTAGEGWYQEEGKPAVSLTPGMVITIPAEVKHWHGAKANSWFSHIAVEVPGENTRTTLTEKFLLYGGAIAQAGAVKGKKNSRAAVSDWMEIEKQRGISVTSSVMQFQYEGFCINILDTPGHQDFSEDTYRTLMAADSAVMVIDGAKGVEPQTRKLFKVCAMRHIPILYLYQQNGPRGPRPV